MTSQEAAAGQWSACFIGKDTLGHPAKAFVSAERYGEYFEITGQIYSSGYGRVYKFSADGHSGAGRLYQRHEYESGAIYITVLNLTETDFVIEVESYGVLRYRRGRCQ